MTDPETAQNRPDGGSEPGAAEESPAPPLNSQKNQLAASAPKKKKPRRASAPAGPPVISVTHPALAAAPAIEIVMEGSSTPTDDSALKDAEHPSAAPTEPAPEAGSDTDATDATDAGHPETEPAASFDSAAAAGPITHKPITHKTAEPVTDDVLAVVSSPTPRAALADSSAPANDFAPKDAEHPSAVPAEPELEPELPETEFLADPPPETRARSAETGSTETRAAETDPAATPTRQALRSEEQARSRAKAAEHPGRRLGRSIANWSRRAALLLLIGLLVLSIGSTITSRPREQPGPGPGERARISAVAQTNALLDQTQQLSGGALPAVDPALKYAVSTLTAASASLARPDPAGQAFASPTPTTTQAATDGSGPPTTDLPRFIAGLGKAAGDNLLAARSVDPGMARLLAAIGTGQALSSQYLAQLSGLPTAVIAFPATGQPDSSDAAAACSGPAEPAAPENSSAPTLPQGLAAVALAEQKSVYAYQLVAARIPSEESFKIAVKLLATHRTSLDSAEQKLRSLCAQAPIREPAFVLAPGFLNQPASGLASVEDQAALAYGDLIGLSEGPVRDWGISQLLKAGQDQLLWSPPMRALPGMPG